MLLEKDFMIRRRVPFREDMLTIYASMISAAPCEMFWMGANTGWPRYFDPLRKNVTTLLNIVVSS